MQQELEHMATKRAKRVIENVVLKNVPDKKVLGGMAPEEICSIYRASEARLEVDRTKTIHDALSLQGSRKKMMFRI